MDSRLLLAAAETLTNPGVLNLGEFHQDISKLRGWWLVVEVLGTRVVVAVSVASSWEIRNLGMCRWILLCWREQHKQFNSVSVSLRTSLQVLRVQAQCGLVQLVLGTWCGVGGEKELGNFEFFGKLGFFRWILLCWWCTNTNSRVSVCVSLLTPAGGGLSWCS